MKIMGRILKIKRDIGKNFEDQKRYWQEFWRSLKILARTLKILTRILKILKNLGKNIKDLDKNFEDP